MQSARRLLRLGRAFFHVRPCMQHSTKDIQAIRAIKSNRHSKASYRRREGNFSRWLHTRNQTTSTTLRLPRIKRAVLGTRHSGPTTENLQPAEPSFSG